MPISTPSYLTQAPTNLKWPIVRNVTVLVIVISAGDSHRNLAHLLLIILENRL